MPASSHASTCGLISASTNFFTLRRMPSCSCVNSMGRLLNCHPGTCCRDPSLHELQVVALRTTARRGTGGALDPGDKPRDDNRSFRISSQCYPYIREMPKVFGLSGRT